MGRPTITLKTAQPLRAEEPPLRRQQCRTTSHLVESGAYLAAYSDQPKPQSVKTFMPPGTTATTIKAIVSTSHCVARQSWCLLMATPGRGVGGVFPPTQTCGSITPSQAIRAEIGHARPAVAGFGIPGNDSVRLR